MVKLLVSISMELEGVTAVRPAEEDHEYFFTVVCTSCRSEHPNKVSVNPTETAEVSGSKGTANFVWRCQTCKREHSASFCPPSSSSKSSSPVPYSAPNAQFAPLVALDCRGLEFTAFHFTGQWTAEGEESGEKFTFDLEEEGEGRWDDYDEKAGGPVGVSELKSKIGRL